jgi:hypothetical protein
MNPAHLFHVSQEEDIDLFHLRHASAGEPDLGGAAVWAVDYQRLPDFLTPADCPRVAFGRGEATTYADAARYLDGVEGRVVVVELEWLDRVRRTPLFVYAFDRTPAWRAVGPKGGLHACREPVAPVECIRIGNPASALMALGADLRARVALWSLMDEIASSSLDYAIIGQRKAGPGAETKPRVL